MSKKKTNRKSSINNRSGLSAFLRQPLVQVGLLAVVAVIVYFIATSGDASSNGLAAEISVEEAYQKYQSGTFVLDVRTQEEWNEYHAPNTTLIPLDQLPGRLSELPKDQEIVVVCRSGNRSQQGRDILRQAGFNATSMAGGLKEWYASGYPTEGIPPQ